MTRNGSNCAVHRGNTTVHRSNTSPSSRHPPSSLNTRHPTTGSSSKARYQLQDPPSGSSSSRVHHPTGSNHNNPSSAGTSSHLTPNRYNEWSQTSEDAARVGDALYGDEPPPSFHDALLAPVVASGSRSEISLASSVGHFLIRPAR